jgi:XRE family aerobic/anaerobic benzoate catabolism transcriptional regulator
MTQDPEALLRGLGARVRALRQARELTVAALAERAGLSRRFLTDLESGKGNISVSRLAAVASALGAPPSGLLFDGGPAASAALDDVWNLLNGLSTAELEEVAQVLRARFAPARARRKVALIGLRGAGKTTIGKRLAARLKVPFLELDRLVEQASGMSLADLFALQGETAYRELEREVLAKVLARPGAAVLATGGGLVTNPEAYALLRRHCFTVWLAARPEDHMSRVVAQGDSRPMRNNPAAMEELRSLLAAREPLYALAHHRADTSRSSLDAATADLVKQVAAWRHDGRRARRES